MFRPHGGVGSSSGSVQFTLQSSLVHSVRDRILLATHHDVRKTRAIQQPGPLHSTPTEHELSIRPQPIQLRNINHWHLPILKMKKILNLNFNSNCYKFYSERNVHKWTVTTGKGGRERERERESSFNNDVYTSLFCFWCEPDGDTLGSKHVAE